MVPVRLQGKKTSKIAGAQTLLFGRDPERAKFGSTMVEFISSVCGAATVRRGAIVRKTP
jgi:hypothetical protein